MDDEGSMDYVWMMAGRIDNKWTVNGWIDGWTDGWMMADE